jgi:N6-L-threonylcarbamoyladenine synthase
VERFLCLGIETSCDETAASVVAFKAGESEVLSSLISSQVLLHAEYGGVVPELASREHLRNLPLIVDQALKDARVSLGDIACMGVTVGPGLKGCLLIGALFGQGLSQRAGIPVLGVNHLEGHILSVFLSDQTLQYPFIALLVSGGHTEVHIVKEFGVYSELVRTIDDAAGEAFDKSAYLLGFSYPGGPALAAAADSVGRSRYQFPLPMRNVPQFSFSGLKTAISLRVRSVRQSVSEAEWLQHRDELACAVQNTIVESLAEKVERVIRETGITRLTVCGGVAANRQLRKRLAEISGSTLHAAESRFCTDNAAMIAYAAAERWSRGVPGSRYVSRLVRSRWPLSHECT